MLLNNPFLKAEDILHELKNLQILNDKREIQLSAIHAEFDVKLSSLDEKSKAYYKYLIERNQSINPLQILQSKLKELYFDKNISNHEALELLKTPVFADFPRLQYVLHQVFEGQSHIEIPETSHDWEPTVSFQDINNKYGYFNADLSPLFQQLAVACKKMTTLIERQAHDDKMAYKLMALFYDPKKDLNENFKLISQKFDKLITTKQDKNIATPYHDAFVTTLNDFPKLQDIKNFDSWISFIMKEGFKSLDIFAKCARTSPAFKTIKEAQDFLLKETYPRANENPTLARLCKNMLISNSGFEAGLKEVNSGWPKKTSDNLPIVDIQDTTGQYFWVKLPPQDMRALYLGNLIPGCCQFINGNSSQCVKDGIRLSDNGFYVLLKSKKTQANPNRIKNDQINDKDYDIVAQSYAWISHNGNLCLDSIEWDSARLSTVVIQDLMTKFSELVFVNHPNIKYINVGKGGQTPKNIYPDCRINETMKQGYVYGDADAQSQIATNIRKEKLDALKERIKDLPAKSQNTILYLAPYFDDIENVPARLLNIIDDLPQKITKINLPPSISTDDFKKITYEEYQEMEVSQQLSISTFCKIFHSQNKEELHHWLATIPDEELPRLSISCMRYDCDLDSQKDVLQRLPRDLQLKTLLKLNYSNLSMLNSSENNIESISLILSMYPTDNERLNALNKTLIAAVSNHEKLPMILDLLQENQRLDALKMILKHVACNPEHFKIILEMIPENQRFDLINVYDAFGIMPLDYVSKKPVSLRMILDLIPQNQRIHAVNGVLKNISAIPESLKIYMELLPEELRLQAVKDKDQYNSSLLMYASSSFESLRILLEMLPKNQRLDAIKEKDSYGLSIVMKGVSGSEKLKIILQLLPEEHRLEAIQNKRPELTTLESLKMILELLPEEQRLESIKYGVSLLNTPESLGIILDLLPKEHHSHALIQKDYRSGKSTLMYVIKFPEYVKMLLELLTVDALIQKDYSGKSTLMYALINPESLKMLLELLTTEQLLDAVKQKDNDGNTLIMYAANKPKSLKMIFERLTKEQLLDVVKQKNNQGDELLTYALNNPESLKMILEVYPSDEERLEALKEYERYGHLTALDYACSFNIIHQIFSEEITEVIMSCYDYLNDEDFSHLTFSILKFMSDMKGLATPDTIYHFVNAVINNQGIEEALNTLLIPLQSDDSFFKPDSKVLIQQCMNQLEPYWLRRIPTVENNPVPPSSKKT